MADDPRAQLVAKMARLAAYNKGKLDGGEKAAEALYRVSHMGEARMSTPFWAYDTNASRGNLTHDSTGKKLIVKMNPFRDRDVAIVLDNNRVEYRTVEQIGALAKDDEGCVSIEIDNVEKKPRVDAVYIEKIDSRAEAARAVSDSLLPITKVRRPKLERKDLVRGEDYSTSDYDREVTVNVNTDAPHVGAILLVGDEPVRSFDLSRLFGNQITFTGTGSLEDKRLELLYIDELPDEAPKTAEDERAAKLDETLREGQRKAADILTGFLSSGDKDGNVYRAIKGYLDGLENEDDKKTLIGFLEGLDRGETKAAGTILDAAEGSGGEGSIFGGLDKTPVKTFLDDANLDLEDPTPAEGEDKKPGYEILARTLQALVEKKEAGEKSSYLSFEDVLAELEIDEEELKKLVEQKKLTGYRDGLSTKFEKKEVLALRGSEPSTPLDPYASGEESVEDNLKTDGSRTGVYSRVQLERGEVQPVVVSEPEPGKPADRLEADIKRRSESPPSTREREGYEGGLDAGLAAGMGAGAGGSGTRKDSKAAQPNRGDADSRKRRGFGGFLKGAVEGFTFGVIEFDDKKQGEEK